MKVRLFSGYASQGASSGYQRVPHRWMRLDWRQADGKADRRVWSYSGKRLPQADSDYDKSLSDFLAGGGVTALCLDFTRPRELSPLA